MDIWTLHGPLLQPDVFLWTVGHYTCQLCWDLRVRKMNVRTEGLGFSCHPCLGDQYNLLTLGEPWQDMGTALGKLQAPKFVYVQTQNTG